MSELHRLIKSVPEDGVRQVRNIFEVNSLDFITGLLRDQILSNYEICQFIYSHKVLPDSWKIT